MNNEELAVLPKTRKEAKELGEKFYYTGKKCKYGHLSKRYISKQCVECNKTYVKENHNKWCVKNRIHVNEYKNKWAKIKRKNDYIWKLNRNMSKAIWSWLKKGKGFQHWEEFVDFTIEELKEHLESKFENWMNWRNYGKYDKNRKTWQVDHKKAVSLCESFEEAWKLSNLQPLEASKNMSKGNRYVG